MFIASAFTALALIAPVNPVGPTNSPETILPPYRQVPTASAPATSCAKVWKTYPYGVGVTGAKDKVNKAKGFSPVTNFKKVSKTKFKAFAKLDSDKDKIACELPKYKNCGKVNSIYKHGAGLTGAKDKVSGSTDKVTSFTVIKSSLYLTNKHLDRDNDKIVCEKL